MSASDDKGHAPVLAALRAWPTDALKRHLSSRRWFAAKGATVSDARVIDAVVTPWGDGQFAIARVGIRVGDVEQVYQVPFSAKDAASPDATDDPAFREGLVDALSNGVVVQADGVRWIAEPVATHPPLALDGATKLGSAEQSNTSITVGDRAIVKLYRVLRPGIHPDVEVTRFLTTRAGFANTPKLLAEARFEDVDGFAVAAMMQELVPNAGDAWSYALERGRDFFAAPRGRELPNRFVEDARRLGEITRAMHEALAVDDDDPAFAPEAADTEDFDRWSQRTKLMIGESMALLERAIGSPTFPKERLAEATALVRRRDHYLGWIDEIGDQLDEDAGLRIRTHGDYHLGQVLRTPSNDFMVIDFEGEPARPMEERREKTSPARDVAGMLRSFAYAAATLAGSVQDKLDVATRELRVARWERDVRDAFLAGYLASDDEDAASLLPEDPENVRALIALFEAEKAFYELAYELNNRPSWAWIPMRGISKLFLAAKRSGG